MTATEHRQEYNRLTTEIDAREPNWQGDFEEACALQKLRTQAHLHYCDSIGLGGVSDDI